MIVDRNYQIDGIKFLLIVLVTIGHVIEPARNNPLANMLYSVIYIFHMPLFIYISGYYCNVKSKEKLVSKGLMFLETFFIIMIPQCLFYKKLSLLLYPENSGWYLLSLFSWYILAFGIYKRGIVSKWGGDKVLCISLLLAIIVFFLPLKEYGNLLSFQRSCMFLPFFMMGYLRKELGLPIIPRLTNLWKTLIGAISLICFVLCCIYSGRVLHVLEFSNANVWYMSERYHLDIFPIFWLKVLVFGGALVTSLSILIFVRLPYRLCLYGSKTLAIYVLQGIFAHILASYFRPNLIMSLFLGVFLLVCTIIILRYIKSKYITNPISAIIQWKI